MTDKSQLRSYAKDVKKSLEFFDISEKIQQRIIKSGILSGKNCVMLYMPLSDEVDTAYLYDYLKKRSVKCCFPVVAGDEMLVLDDSAGFQTGAFGIDEPLGNPVLVDDIDAVIVPGVMYDVSCKRLGRGRGYYDRFLAGSKALKIGVCPDILLVESIPSESHDLPVDMVITEKRMITDD